MEYYGLKASPSRRWALLALLLKDRSNRRETNILHLQKIIRYFEYLRNTTELQYSNFKLGVVSYELEENLQTLQESGLVEKDDSDYVLTEQGEKVAQKLLSEFDRKELEKLLFAKQQLNDLTPDETMYFMYRLIPESVANSTEYHRLEKKKVTLIQSLFMKGRINAATAAKWLDISEKDFLDSLCK
jgi:DNA-binding HxlR family transcriptional regulator